MNSLILPCPIGQVSDGHHTFDELYEHRCTLFLALMQSNPATAWYSKLHHDGSEWSGWFVAGMMLPTGDITYHLPMSMWEMATQTGALMLKNAPRWDGHTPADVISRLQEWIKTPF